MNSEPPRRRPLRIVAIVAAALVGIVAAVLVGVEWTAARRWKAMEAGIRELIAEAAAREAKRPTVVGEIEPGNAWDDYLQALEATAARPVTFSSSVFKLFLGHSPQADRAVVESEVAALAPALAHLSRGARKAEARAPLRWEGESVLIRSGEGVLRRLAEIAVCKARLLREKGDAKGGVRTLLEAAQFARDGLSGTSSEFEWEGLSALEEVFAEVTDLLCSRFLRHEELALLDPGLRTLDETLPRDGRSVLNDVAFLGSHLLRHDPFYAADETYRKPRPILPGWRHAFSLRIFKADAFSRWSDVARAHAAAGTKGWDEAKGVFDENVNLLERPPENPVVNRLPPPSLETNRAREAQLRMLRMAVQFLRKQPVVALGDPFGPLQHVEKIGALPPDVPRTGRIPAELLYKEEGGRLRVWSRGPNGVDDGGNVASRPVNTLGSTTIIGPALGAADDLVLEVER